MACSFVVALAIGLTIGAGPAMAGHYLIADVPDVIGKAHHATLKGVGLTDTKQLYERSAARKQRRALAAASGINLNQLTAWARFLDLMQISGIGPKMVRLLNAAGVPNLKAFKRSNAAAVHAAMRAANRGGRYSEVVPSVGVLQGWIKRAGAIPLRLQ